LVSPDPTPVKAPQPILYCHCAYAQVVPPEVKRRVLERLLASGVEFDSVADLCQLSAGRDPALQQAAGQAGLRIVACFPRAVKNLFAAAGVPLPTDETTILNMREQPAEEIVDHLLRPAASAGDPQP
jgi:hypothetical protein